MGKVLVSQEARFVVDRLQTILRRMEEQINRISALGMTLLNPDQSHWDADLARRFSGELKKQVGAWLWPDVQQELEHMVADLAALRAILERIKLNITCGCCEDDMYVTVRRMQTVLTSGLGCGLAGGINEIVALGALLSDPEKWDGELALQFRTSLWPEAREKLEQMATYLEALSVVVEYVTRSPNA